jgi:hypothetical protein
MPAPRGMRLGAINPIQAANFLASRFCIRGWEWTTARARGRKRGLFNG